MLIFSLLFIFGVSFVAADTHEISNSTAAIDLFALMMKLMSKAVSETVEGSVNLAYTCSKNGAIPIAFHSDLNGMPFVFCKEVACLEANKINCEANVTMEFCKGENNQWINGFHERFENGKNSTMVECCQYKDGIKMEFLKKINVTNDATFEREEIYESKNLVALTVFSNAEMHGNDKNETFYSISVYQMICPGVAILGKNVIRTSSNAKEFIKDEKMEAIKNLASSAREIGLKIKNAKPKPKSILNEEDSLLSYLESKYVKNTGDLYDNGGVDGTHQTRWTPASGDIMSKPASYDNVASNFGHPYVNNVIADGIRSHKIKWNPYISKQHFSSIEPKSDEFKNPFDFHADNIVVKKFEHTFQ